MVIANIRNIVLIVLLALCLCACAVVPRNLDSNSSDVDTDTFFVRSIITNNEYSAIFRNLAIKERKTNHLDLAEFGRPRFSSGDWLKLKIYSMPNYDGIYQLNPRGQLELPFSQPLPLNGLTRDQAISLLQIKLHDLDWFKDTHTLVDISIVRFATANVSVFGAVFNPGRITINGQPATRQQDPVLQQSGAHTNDRSIATALQAAGGVRPDANLAEVIIKRDNSYFSIDLSKLVKGSSFTSIPSLINGDEIYVATLEVEHTDLIRPSQITPPGMRILMSNLTAPALNNALSAVGADATRLPYGASLLDAALSANCVGGTHQANASRTVLLVTRHYGSSEQLVIRRSINQLLANTSDYSVNPFLMPNDGIACYDSRFTNIRDVARGLGELFGPILLGGLL